MSTKELEMLVEKAEERAFRDVHGSAMAEAARKELETIKRAAKTMDAWNQHGQKRLDPEMARAWRLVESIAKDAP